jgi:DNA-binding MarR family transcriptional regulator
MNITKIHHIVLTALSDKERHYIHELASTLDRLPETIHAYLNDLVRDGLVIKEPCVFPGVYAYRLA